MDWIEGIGCRQGASVISCRGMDAIARRNSGIRDLEMLDS